MLSYIMNNQYIFPTQCKKCGTIFDLYYELLEANERIDNEEIREKLGQKLAESLCWGCKQQILNALSIGTSKKQEESFDSLDELFLELELE